MLFTLFLDPNHHTEFPIKSVMISRRRKDPDSEEKRLPGGIQDYDSGKSSHLSGRRVTNYSSETIATESLF